MKLFKKALLATAIFGAVGANAAVLSSDPIKLSAEGVAAGNEALNQEFAVDFVVKKLTPSASVITLTFDSAVDLTDLEGLLGTSEVDIFNDPSAGTGVVFVDANANDAQDAAEPSLLTFNYGTGSFTFDRLVVDADAKTITFEVNLGNPVTAESAFRMSASTDAGIDFSGASTVAYASEEADGTAIETGTGTLATVTSQFSFAVTQVFDGRIERAVQKSFSKNDDGTSNDTVDTAKFYLTNNEALGAPLLVTDAVVKFSGDFDNGVAATSATDQVQVGDFTATVGTPALPSFKAVELALGAPALKDGKKNAYDLTFTGNSGDGTTASAIVIPETGNIEASVTIESSNGDDVVIASSVDAGKWALDALVVNIPYFPVGFDGLNTSVHFANESANDADVIVTAIDQKGNEYSGTMTDLAGDTVTKYSQVAVMDALKAPAGSKLSVTFNINANEGDVKAYAFSNAGTGRQALVTSQQDGK